MKSFPRVALPGVAPEARELAATLAAAGRANEVVIQRQREGMVAAMIRRGYKPYLGHVFRAPRKTKHVRHMERLAARSTKGAVS